MSPAAPIVTVPGGVAGGAAVDVVVAGAAVVVGSGARARRPSERLPALHDASSVRSRTPTAHVISSLLPRKVLPVRLTFPTRSRRPYRGGRRAPVPRARSQ